MIAAADFRMMRVRAGADVYTPVLRNGRMLGPAELADLEHVPDINVNVERIARIALLDESWPQPWSDTPPFRTPGIKAIRRVPLELGDSELVVADVRGIELLAAGATPGVVGPHYVALAHFRKTVLSSIAWGALRDGLLTGTCAVIEHWQTDPNDDGRIIDGIITSVRLGTAESSCFANARVLATWSQ
jgi:hypothetical protein